MTLKKLFFWFWSTLLIGAVAGLGLAFIMALFQGEEVVGSITKQILMGLTLAAVAQLGFFSYLVFNWLSRGLIRNKTTYDILLIAMVVFILGSLVALNSSRYSGVMLWKHLSVSLLIVVVAFIVAWLKSRWTNASAFIPTLFFMIVATVLEDIPSFSPKGEEVTLLLLLQSVIILLSCNSWQILQLHRLVGKTEKK
ncbi:KinB-signaling pathway activation protein [Hazenella sp. IB182357]|uniref:KinB-signaling pathway activation protein n=1 Tax=Polycladospora coralii TaxID=2771432 RepID=A0A926RVG8_9BACL|nr:KinB-signaling pathway activation protein [Polycladospora coralii]MBD1373589.1 KinB-signaling pathway activation protein [Polycladospora coralii]MBS7531959.1 KinB-signaling pathway activation protein [Polycladospora coralii]